jgi:hypothetical protein
VPPVPFDVSGLRARIEQRFRVYDVQTDEHVVAFFVDAPRATLETDFNELKKELKPEGLVPLLKYQGGEHAIYILRNPRGKGRDRWVVNAVLFALTIMTVTYAGALIAFPYAHADLDLGSFTMAEYTRLMLTPASLLAGALNFGLPLLAILAIHEAGHYIAAKRHDMNASLPYFLPLPGSIGTLGAFIAFREPMPNRKVLFDVGVAGPLAGFVAALIVYFLGFVFMALHPVEATATGDFRTIATPLSFNFTAGLFGISEQALLHPMVLAACVGFVLTAMNMIPAGQLDGGHVASAMFGHRAHIVAYSAVFGLIVLGMSPALSRFIGLPVSGEGGWIGIGAPNLLLIAVLLGFMGVRHPPTLDGVSTLDARRQWIGWPAFAVGIFCAFYVPMVFTYLVGSG